jgi:hypothetical protein
MEMELFPFSNPIFHNRQPSFHPLIRRSSVPPFIPVDVSVDVKSLFSTLLRRQIQNQKKLQALINKGIEACYADDRI